jgi:hypothetical protein
MFTNQPKAAKMTLFQAGRTYQTRSICDHDCIITVSIKSRTAKTVKTVDGKTFRVAVWNDGSCEYIKPWGSYSMAPMLKAC